MGIKKYKYYFKKPKLKIVEDALYSLLVTGGVVVALGSPYLWLNFWRNALGFKESAKHPEKKLKDNFYNLKKQGLIKIEEKNRQIYISLTEKGRQKAGMFQINNLKVKIPKKWDEKWRVVIFDISELKKTHREAFRGKLKELLFHQLQKSVWVCPFDCEAEIELLRDFFGLSEENVRLIVAESIGDDKKLRDFFELT